MQTTELRQIIEREGVRRGLAYLNERTPLRFTSLYLFHADPERRNYFYDRERPDSETADGVPDLFPYCVVPRKKREYITLSADDLEDQPIKSFVGVPITDLAGDVLGSLCHFDFTPHHDLDDVAAELELAAPHFLSVLE